MKKLILALLTIFFVQVNITWSSDIPSNYKEITSFASECNDNFWMKAGQILIIDVKNLNTLGTTFSVSTHLLNEEQSAIILPRNTHRFKFSIFGEEPMGWNIKTKTSSDVCSVTVTIYSTWKEGDPSNPRN